MFVDEVHNVKLKSGKGGNVDELTTLEYILEDYIMDKVDAAIQIALGHKSISNNKATNSIIPTDTSSNFETSSSQIKVSDDSQIQKFYSRYPQLKPQDKKANSRWSSSKIKSFIADYESSENLESVAEKYNIRMSTMHIYYKKFKSSESRDMQEGGA